MTERQGVEIDYCPKCPGVWLDRGELDKIIERSGDGEYRSSEREEHRSPLRHQDLQHHTPGHGHGYDPRRKKKESFLQDLFDF